MPSVNTHKDAAVELWSWTIHKRKINVCGIQYSRKHCW